MPQRQPLGAAAEVGTGAAEATGVSTPWRKKTTHGAPSARRGRPRGSWGAVMHFFFSTFICRIIHIFQLFYQSCYTSNVLYNIYLYVMTYHMIDNTRYVSIYLYIYIYIYIYTILYYTILYTISICMNFEHMVIAAM